MGRFNNLPKEIMLEILTRLPTETVLDCKLVCRPWRELVRLPSFSQLHLNRLDTGKSSFIIYTRKFEEVSYAEYAEYDDNFHETLISRKTRMNLGPLLNTHDCSLVGSCNGLICLGAHHRDDTYRYYYAPAYICNPITREYIVLPRSKGRYWWTGFGYTLSTNKYKVVRMWQSERDSKDEIEVYTLGSGNGWINVGNTDINVKEVSLGVGVFANEALYWTKPRKGTILAFHLTDQKFSELPLPHCLRQAGVQIFSIKLGVLGGFLSATVIAGDCDIWLLKKMNEDNSNDLSWCKEFSFGSFLISRPLGHTKSGRLLYYGNNNMYSYDPKDSSTKMDPCCGKSSPETIPHKNTLVSLEILGEKDIKSMESSESASSSEQKTVIKHKFKQAENSDKLKKLRNEVRDL